MSCGWAASKPASTRNTALPWSPPMRSPTSRTSCISSAAVSSVPPGRVHSATDAHEPVTHVQLPLRNAASTNTRHQIRNCAGRRVASANAQLHNGSLWNAVAMVSVIASASSMPASRPLPVEDTARDHLLEGAVVPPRDLLRLGPAEVELDVVLDGETH